LGRESTHLAGADNERGRPGESGVLADGLDRRARERDDPVVDRRLGPASAPGPERPLEGRLEDRTDPVGGPGVLEGPPDLPENLVLAEHHRLDSSGDAKKMLEARRPVQESSVLDGYVGRNIGEGVPSRAGGGDDIPLGPVAGPEDKGLGDPGSGEQPLECVPGVLAGCGRDPVGRRRVVVV